MNSKVKKSILVLIFVIVLVVFDQITKLLAVVYLNPQNSGTDFVIWDGVFRLKYLQNYGAAFGMMQGKTVVLMIITTIAIVVFGWLYFRIPDEKRYLPLQWIIIFLVAGAIGNFIDRIRLGYVIDFFYLEIINFPIFNVADIFVTCAEILFVLLLIFYYKDEDFNRILPSRKKEEK